MGYCGCIGEGTSERILGNFVKEVDRKDVILSTKFTPQIASDSPDFIPLAKSGQIKTIGVSNHNLAEIKRAKEIRKVSQEEITNYNKSGLGNSIANKQERVDFQK